MALWINGRINGQVPGEMSVTDRHTDGQIHRKIAEWQMLLTLEKLFQQSIQSKICHFLKFFQKRFSMINIYTELIDVNF